MRAVHLGQRLAVVVTFSVMLLIAGLFRFGAALRYGVVVLPTLDLRLGRVHIVVYRTHYPECPPYLPCLPESVAPPQEYYVVWSINELATAAQPYGRTARHLLVVLLKR